MLLLMVVDIAFVVIATAVVVAAAVVVALAVVVVADAVVVVSLHYLRNEGLDRERNTHSKMIQDGQ